MTEIKLLCSVKNPKYFGRISGKKGFVIYNMIGYDTNHKVMNHRENIKRFDGYLDYERNHLNQVFKNCWELGR